MLQFDDNTVSDLIARQQGGIRDQSYEGSRAWSRVRFKLRTGCGSCFGCDKEVRVPVPAYKKWSGAYPNVRPPHFDIPPKKKVEQRVPYCTAATLEHTHKHTHITAHARMQPHLETKGAPKFAADFNFGQPRTTRL